MTIWSAFILAAPKAGDVIAPTAQSNPRQLGREMAGAISMLRPCL